jgi:uncharacterized repeat protein (TIGR03806 family)
MSNRKIMQAVIGGCWILLLGLMLDCQRPLAKKTGPVHFVPQEVPYPKLSDYAFFQGELAALQPNDQVLPYDLNTTLFSDYAHKARFVWMPKGKMATVKTDGILDFPDNAVLIKNFYYPKDFRQPDGPRDIVETRLLFKTQGTWKAYTYIWNEDETDAELSLVGDIKPVSWVDKKGSAQSLQYVVPNKNQCKSCHHQEQALLPIGPKAYNLNKAFHYPDGTVNNQLSQWQKVGYLPAGDYAAQFKPMPNWEDKKSGTIADRALAYLDVNCGHCHSAQGGAHMSGLYLNYGQTDKMHLGILKPPVAAGRGSGDRRFDVVPSHPEASILLYRMEASDPGVMMPELGRAKLHQEGIALISDWIKSMPN